MKMTIILTVFCFFHSAARINGQTLSLDLQDTEISKALNSIEKQANYRFLYNSKLKDLKQKISISVTNAGIDEVLDKIFSGTSLSYRKLDNNLIAIRSENKDEQDLRITGRVSNENGEPLQGVSITVKGTSLGTSTDNNGNFAITVPDNATLLISFIGYSTQEVAVNNQSVLTIKMVLSQQQMEQVVVVGYGTARKKDLTGSSATIRGADIVNIPALTATQAIQGKVSGVQVINSGAPGSTPNVRIRGVGSVLGGADPLYVVDGIITTDIRNINSSDILTIDILKDASSTAIYGARAANGVVLITTRAGNKTKFSINYNAQAGVKLLTHKVQMAGPGLYAAYSNEAAGAPAVTGGDITGSVSWYEEITRPAIFNSHNLSLSGGKNKYRYFLSLGYLNENGILIDNKYARYTARYNHDFAITSKLKVGNNIGYSHYVSENKPYSLFTTAYIAAPIFSAVNPDGSYGNTSNGISNVGNPYATLKTTNDRSFGDRLQTTLWGEYQLIKGLSFRSQFGIDLERNNGWNYTPAYKTFLPSGAEGAQHNDEADLSFSRDSIYQWVWDNYLTYEKKFAKEHDLRLTLGHTAERRNGWSDRAVIANKDIPNNKDAWQLNFKDTARGQQNFRDPIGNYFRRESYFIRANYKFKDRYLLNATFRRDANSNFPAHKRWGNFPSVGIGWLVSSEKFMATQKFFNNLKLRASFGLVGNDAIDPGKFDLHPTERLYAYFGTNRIDGAIVRGIVDPNLQWEVVREIDAGIEFAVLDNQLSGEIDFYSKRARNALFIIPYPSVGFLNSFLTNAAEIVNTGVELSLQWNKRVNTKLNYTLRGNFTYNKNTVTNVGIGRALNFGGLGNGSTATQTLVGQPIGSFWVYRTDGIFQNDAEINAYPHVITAIPGDFKIVDKNNDGIIDNLDREHVGSYQPKVYYGLSGSVNWKQFDFSMDIVGVAGNKVYNGKKGLRFGSNYNVEYDVANNRWTPGSNNNRYPGASNVTPYPTDYFIESGSFARINNITAGYTFAAMKPWKRIERMRIFASAQNPFIYTKYTGFTPELPGNQNEAGIELNIYPISASYLIGVNVQFK
ncbi:MAG: TonB-dependent receptor [Chitinophagaceae bacterium]